MINIKPMFAQDVSQALAIWQDRYAEIYDPNIAPCFTNGGMEAIKQYLQSRINEGHAIAAFVDGKMTGYMAWMYFDFHDERTAFCPIVGHAARSDQEHETYHALYRAAAQEWIGDERYNHLWMIYNDRAELKSQLYEWGFGSYVMDAYIKANELHVRHDCSYPVTLATEKDIDALFQLADNTRSFYLRSPIFLNRHMHKMETLMEMIHQRQVYLAWDDVQLVGAISLKPEQGYDWETLATPNTISVGGIGVYIHPEYRGKGIGNRLLEAVANHCIAADMPYLHLSYETANPFASAFWPKRLHPLIRSVRRTVNKDANA